MSNECCNNNCNQGRDCPERRVADRRATGAQFAADSHLQTVKAQQAVISAKDDEIVALTAEVARMAAALDAGGTVAGSAGDDAKFVALLDWCLDAAKHGSGAVDAERMKGGVAELIAYIDSRSASAPSVDRNSVLEEAAAIADRFSRLYTAPDVGYDNGYTMAAKRIAEEVRRLKYAPQPVDAAQAVPEDTARLDLIETVAAENGYFYIHGNRPRFDLLGLGLHGTSLRAALDGLASRRAEAACVQLTDTTKGA